MSSKRCFNNKTQSKMIPTTRSCYPINFEMSTVSMNLTSTLRNWFEHNINYTQTKSNNVISCCDKIHFKKNNFIDL